MPSLFVQKCQLIELVSDRHLAVKFHNLFPQPSSCTTDSILMGTGLDMKMVRSNELTHDKLEIQDRDHVMFFQWKKASKRQNVTKWHARKSNQNQPRMGD